MKVILLTLIAVMLFCLQIFAQTKATVQLDDMHGGRDVWDYNSANRYIRVVIEYSYAGKVCYGAIQYEGTVLWNNNNIDFDNWYGITNSTEPNIDITLAANGTSGCSFVDISCEETYTSNDYSPGSNGKNIECGEPYVSILGGCFIYELPILVGDLKTEMWNNNSLLPSDKFTEGDKIYISTSYQSEGEIVIFRKESESWIEQTITSDDNGKYIIASVGNGVDQTYGIKVSNEGYYSVNYAVTTVEIYPKPQLQVDKNYYACEGVDFDPKYEIVKAEGDVKIVLLLGLAIVGSSKLLTIDGSSIRSIVADFGSLQDDKSYVLQIENVLETPGGDKYYSGLTKYSFNTATLPQLNPSTADTTVICPSDKTVVDITVDGYTGASPLIPICGGVTVKEIRYRLKSGSWVTSNSFSNVGVANSISTSYYVNNTNMCIEYGTANVSSIYSQNVDITRVNIKPYDCGKDAVIYSFDVSCDEAKKNDVILQFVQDGVTQTMPFPESVVWYSGIIEFSGYYTSSKLCEGAGKSDSYHINYDLLSIVSSSSSNFDLCLKNWASIGISVTGGNSSYLYELFKQDYKSDWIKQTDYLTDVKNHTFGVETEGMYMISASTTDGCTVSKDAYLSIPNRLLFNAYSTLPVMYCKNNSDGMFYVSVSNKGDNEFILYRANNVTFDNNNNPLYSSSTAVKSYTGSGGSFSFTGLSCDEYYYVTCASGNCEIQTDLLFVDIYPKFTLIDYNTTNVTGCVMRSNGTFTVNTGGGAGTCTYSLYNAMDNVIQGQVTVNAETYTFTGLAIGSYYAKVSMLNSVCEVTTGIDSIGLENEFVISKIMANDVVGCYTNSNGYIDIELLGSYSSGSLWYTINDSKQTVFNGSLIKGLGKIENASLTIGDEACTDDAFFTIGSPSQITFDSLNNVGLKCSYSATDIAINSATDSIMFGISNFRYYLKETNSSTIVNSNTDAIFRDVGVGNYSVYVSTSDDATCVSQEQSIIISSPAALKFIGVDTLDNNGFAIACKGETANVTFHTVGGFGNRAVACNDLSGLDYNITNSVAILGKNSYNAYVTDVNNCVDTFNFSISEPLSAVVLSDIIKSESSCELVPDGAITITPQGGIAPYWVTVNDFTNSDSDSIYVDKELSVTFGDRLAGAYAISVLDANSCKYKYREGGDSFIKLAVLSAPNIGDNVTDVLCYGDNTGSIGVVVNSAAPKLYNYYFRDTLTSTIDSVISVANNEMVRFNSLRSGVYERVVYEQGRDCPFSSIINIRQNSKIDTTLLVISSSTTYSKDGAIIADISGGSAPYNIYIKQGVNMLDSVVNVPLKATFADIYAGYYTISVTDKFNCTASFQTSVLKPNSDLDIEIDATNTNNVKCPNEANGAIKVAVTGGWFPYKYKLNNIISDNPSDAVFEKLPANTYIVYVEDKRGVVDSVQHIITQPILSTDINIIDVDCFGDSTGWVEFDVQVENSMNDVSLKFFNMDYATYIYPTNFRELKAGIYNYTIKFGDGCARNNKIEIKQPDTHIISSVATNYYGVYNIMCNRLTDTIFTTVKNGTPPYIVEVFNGYKINSDIPLDPTFLPKGKYTVVSTDANGCADVKQVELTEPAGENECAETEADCNGRETPQASVQMAYNAMCSYSADGGIELTAQGGTPPYFYYWNTAKKTMLSSYSGYSKGSYTVVVTDVYNCADTISFDISANDSLYAILDDVGDPTCYNYSNGFINISAYGGTQPYTYLWSSGDDIPYVSDLQKGTYFVKINDANKCEYNTEFNLTNPHKVEVYLDREANICSNQIVQLDAHNPDMEHHWYNNNGFESFEQIVEVREEGTYFVEVTNYNSCLGVDSIKVNVSDEIIESNFLLQSVAYVGDTIVMIEISWPVPEFVEWMLPTSFEVLYESTNEVEFAITQEGVFDIGLTTYNDICTEYTHKILEVKPSVDRPLDYKSDKKSIIKNVIVSPVPSKGPFNIDVELNRECDIIIEIVHLLGGKHFTQTMRGNKHYVLNFSNANIADGVHTIRIVADDEVEVRKIVIEK